LNTLIVDPAVSSQNDVKLPASPPKKLTRLQEAAFMRLERQRVEKERVEKLELEKK